MVWKFGVFGGPGRGGFWTPKFGQIWPNSGFSGFLANFDRKPLPTPREVGPPPLPCLGDLALTLLVSRCFW